MTSGQQRRTVLPLLEKVIKRLPAVGSGTRPDAKSTLEHREHEYVISYKGR